MWWDDAEESSGIPTSLIIHTSNGEIEAKVIQVANNGKFLVDMEEDKITQIANNISEDEFGDLDDEDEFGELEITLQNGQIIEIDETQLYIKATGEIN